MKCSPLATVSIDETGLIRINWRQPIPRDALPLHCRLHRAPIGACISSGEMRAAVRAILSDRAFTVPETVKIRLAKAAGDPEPPAAQYTQFESLAFAECFKAIATHGRENDDPMDWIPGKEYALIRRDYRFHMTIETGETRIFSGRDEYVGVVDEQGTLHGFSVWPMKNGTTHDKRAFRAHEWHEFFDLFTITTGAPGTPPLRCAEGATG